MDNRGHGKSGGKTMFVPSIKIMADDFKGYAELVMKSFYCPESGFETSPSVFLIAHSMGATIALRYLCENGPKIGNLVTI